MKIIITNSKFMESIMIHYAFSNYADFHCILTCFLSFFENSDWKLYLSFAAQMQSCPPFCSRCLSQHVKAGPCKAICKGCGNEKSHQIPALIFLNFWILFLNFSHLLKIDNLIHFSSQSEKRKTEQIFRISQTFC